MQPGRQRQLIRAAHRRTRLSTDELWLRYFTLGGTAGPADLAAFLEDGDGLPPTERDRVALAVNEQLDRLAGGDRAPYSRASRAVDDTEGPLGALVALLRGTHRAPPDALAAAVAAAAAHLRCAAVVYLADEAAERLVPLPGGPGADREPLRIEGTLPGRAYRLLQTQTAVTADGQARLWVPVVDGLERLGVLDVMTGDPHDLQDPHLRRQCWWLAHLLGHVVTAVDGYGDVVDRLRATRPPSAPAMLARALLPPPTAGTDEVVVAACGAPAHDGGGALYDYALSATQAQVAVVDATGSGLPAGLAAAVAVSAYRAARRTGAGLFEQVDAAHAAVSEHVAGHVPAVAAELDLTDGRLRYLAAGHPAPLLLRQGRVVRYLLDGRRPALGQEVRSATVGEEHLKRGDTVVLYTDGVVGAQDAAGQTFGIDRLAEVLHRATAERVPLPEVARRVVRAVLAHQHADLRDDATILLVRWTGHRRGRFDPAPVPQRVTPAGAGPSAPTAA